MRQGIESVHMNDANGNPAGGSTKGVGILIDWQNGPLGRHVETCIPGMPCDKAGGCTRIPPNGAFVEDVIEAALDRLRYYQSTRFACGLNEVAIDALCEALQALDARTRERERRTVEGTHAE